MDKSFQSLLRTILKNKDVPEHSLEIVEKDGSIFFISNSHYDITNFEILNAVGQLGVKFELVAAYENNKLVETQVIIKDEEYKKLINHYE